MGKEILTLGDIEIEKTKFYCYKSLVPQKDVDSEKVLVSNRITGYLYNDNRVKTLHIMLPKTSVYVKSYDDEQTKWMYLLIKDNDLLEKVILFGIKSGLIQTKNLVVSWSTRKNF